MNNIENYYHLRKEGLIHHVSGLVTESAEDLGTNIAETLLYNELEAVKTQTPEEIEEMRAIHDQISNNIDTAICKYRDSLIEEIKNEAMKIKVSNASITKEQKEC
ncbi:MAG: hypothetical protein COA94_05600 [Rickettsiales bacterium]|nr:MAG: hypothetical protein COA94_05600 [Rickettsiales bacterium]